MSLNFHANQYERSFRSNCLGNWEVSKWYPHERPRARRGHTKVIADDRGHLLPGVPRIEPWGHFRSTWQLPKRITRKLARDINTLRPPGKKHLTSWEKRSSHIPLIEKTSTPPLPSAGKEKRISSSKKEIPIVDDTDLKLNEYQPYQKDENDYSPQMGADRTTKIVDTAQRVREDIESYSQSVRGTPPKKVEAPMTDESRHSSAKSRKSSKSSRGDSPKRDSTPRASHDYLGPQYAKDQAQDNLKHQPLPDMISDQIFQSMQMKSEKYPGLGIDKSPKATAVGHKKFVSPGPTQCSKLKVYRPKTASNKLPPAKLSDRPKTGISKSLGEIDLAICWDLVPANPHDEPKRPTHIDGSNGSIAPSVFTIVKPKEDTSLFPTRQTSPTDIAKKMEETEKEKETLRKARPAWESENPPSREKPVNPSAVMDIINNNLEIARKENKINEEFRRSISSGRCSDQNANSHKNSLAGCEENHNPNVPSQKNSDNGSKKSNKNSISSLDSDKLAKQKHFRSSPNLTTVGVESNKSKHKMLFSRPCIACETKLPLDSHTKSKNDYKMAFKAGVPTSGTHSHRVDSSGSKASSKQLSIPKPKKPFAARSYSINTLAPPFSLWPGTTGMDYPEHWRLASVYQHSYKPIEQRKKPLLQGIFH
ncbi:uncharacterized protein LOC106661692 [Cimex lectularius]|uniref:Cilia- and flagella-associated protein 126 n=1 Tax=Cimex lectularius TaxID=79782 RepID=A0A8I6RE25_CIMLE|nr:uncharacterized protein LOC106661692 [Cimex lectularius]